MQMYLFGDGLDAVVGQLVGGDGKMVYKFDIDKFL